MDKQKDSGLLYRLFVEKPVGFVGFAFLGILLFIFLFLSVKIPVYTTVETTLEKSGDVTRAYIDSQTVVEDTPVFFYLNRDDYLEKVTDYTIEDGYIKTKELGDSFYGKDIFVDVQTEEKSLLEIVFIQGGKN